MCVRKKSRHRHRHRHRHRLRCVHRSSVPMRAERSRSRAAWHCELPNLYCPIGAAKENCAGAQSRGTHVRAGNDHSAEARRLERRVAFISGLCLVCQCRFARRRSGTPGRRMLWSNACCGSQREQSGIVLAGTCGRWPPARPSVPGDSPIYAGPRGGGQACPLVQRTRPLADIRRARGAAEPTTAPPCASFQSFTSAKAA